VCATAIALTAGYALALQFYLAVAKAQADGTSLGRAVGNYFGYFTVLTNCLVARVAYATAKGRIASRLTSPAIQSGVAVYIAVVGITYSLLLRSLWNPEHFQKVADVLLHDVVPVAFVLYWVVFIPKKSLGWKDALTWLLYPLVYFAYTMIRGAIVGWYPYHFIDVAALGFPRALMNALVLLCGFLALSLLAIAGGGMKFGQDSMPDPKIRH